LARTATAQPQSVTKGTHPDMALKIVTWNINSVRLRIGLVERFTKEAKPDVLCLQETKSPLEAFPYDALKEMGYAHIHAAGMKGYNGVAIASKKPFSRTDTRHWCDKEDARHVWVTLRDGTEVHNFYVPAGGDIPDPALNDKFAHKLRFLDEVTSWFSARKAAANKFVLVGDLNIAPLESDVWSHKALLKVVSHTPVEVDKLARLQQSHDWVDAVRAVKGENEKVYSWWSYRAADWEAADKGRRLDHVWVTPALGSKVRTAEVFKGARGLDETVGSRTGHNGPGLKP
jgi:exodeoxyribonuclease-3